MAPFIVGGDYNVDPDTMAAWLEEACPGRATVVASTDDTCFGPQGSSALDYFVTSPLAARLISGVQVVTGTCLRPHRPVLAEMDFALLDAKVTLFRPPRCGEPAPVYGPHLPPRTAEWQGLLETLHGWMQGEGLLDSDRRLSEATDDQQQHMETARRISTRNRGSGQVTCYHSCATHRHGSHRTVLG